MNRSVIEVLGIKSIIAIICLFCFISLSYANDTVTIEITNDDEEQRFFIPIGVFTLEIVAHANPAIATNWQWTPQYQDLQGQVGYQDTEYSCLQYVGSWYSGGYGITVEADPSGPSSSYTACVYVCSVYTLMDNYWNTGTLYVPLNETIDIYAESYPKTDNPYTVYFPPELPFWEVTDYPDGADSEDVTLVTGQSQCVEGGGVDKLTFSATVPGKYTIHAKCSEYDSGDDIDVVVVEPKLEYNDPVNGWTNITADPPTTIYVCIGTEVDFRSVTYPSGASWPAQKPVWKLDGELFGDPGDAEIQITFNTISSSTSDYKIVTAECGNTETVYVIVYNFTGSCTPQDPFTGRSYDNFGICEQFDLSCNIWPTGLTAEQIGKIKWFKDSVYARIFSVDENAGTATYRASNRERIGENADYIWCEVQSGPSAGEYYDYTIPVIEPSGGYCTKVPNSYIGHLYDTYSLALITYFYLEPKNVSFAWIRFYEGYCTPYECTGWFDSGARYNYFHGGEHWDWPIDVMVDWGDQNTGCRVMIENPPYNNYDEWDYAIFYFDGVCTPYTDGHFQWNIPWYYHDPTLDYYAWICDMNQETSVYDGVNDPTGYQAGDATIQKDGEGENDEHYNNHWDDDQLLF